VSKILITPQGFNFIRPQVEKYLAPQNEYIFTNGLIADSSKLCELLSDVDAVVIGSENIDKTIIDSAKELKVIVRFGTTIENIDVDYAEKAGIKVFSIKSKYTVDGVSRLCLMFLLNYIFNIQKHTRDASGGSWVRYMNSSPATIRVGLVGAGDIAKGFLKLGRNLGFNFGYYSRNNNKVIDDLGAVYYSNLHDLVQNSDVVSLHIPLTNETESIISAEILSLFANKLLINTSRAKVVDQIGLRRMIEEVDSFTYFTDVLCTEPPENEDLKLIGKPNVLSTAHIGGYSDDALADVAFKALDILREEL
jgi:D-3-phosphoglycerate dehydrogenase